MGGEKVKNYFSLEVDQFKENAVPQENKQNSIEFLTHIGIR